MPINPFITILMAVNRDEGLLSDTINSVLTQTYSNFEFLIINDGTDNGVIDTVKEFDDSRIKLINIEKYGLTKSLNHGLNICEGEYIARQDGGDISYPQRLQKQVSKMVKHPNLALLGTCIKNLTKNGEYLGDTIFPDSMEMIINHIGFQNTFWHGTVMFTKKVATQLNGYREEYKMAQDYDFWLRISECYDIANLNEVLYERRVDKNSISLRTKKIQVKFAKIARNAHEARIKNEVENLSELEKMNEYCEKAQVSMQHTEGDYHFYCGRLLLIQRKCRVARRYFFRSIISWPFNFVPFIFLFVTLLPTFFLDRLENFWKYWQKRFSIQLQ